MTEETARFLLTSEGRDLIRIAESFPIEKTVAAVTKLRKLTNADIAGAMCEIVEARRRAVKKFPALWSQLYLDQDVLEQASDPAAARYHASRFVDAGIKAVVDICAGAGSDALAFAEAGLHVIAVEIDPARALFIEENIKAAGYSERVIVHYADALETDYAALTAGLPHPVAAWIDPSRRSLKGRVVNPDDYLPPLSIIEKIKAEGVVIIGAKVASAVEHDLAVQLGAHLEFLSVDRECKEGLLWWGQAGKLSLAHRGEVTATIIDDEATHTIAGSDYIPSMETRPIGAGGYIYEPDPAVIRAHLIGVLAEMLNAFCIDPQIAYITATEYQPTPFARGYRILDRFPYHLRNLQRALKERRIGRVVIKKRGFPEEPEQVRKQLKLNGTNEITVILTRCGVQLQAILCEPVN